MARVGCPTIHPEHPRHPSVQQRLEQALRTTDAQQAELAPRMCSDHRTIPTNPLHEVSGTPLLVNHERIHDRVDGRPATHRVLHKQPLLRQDIVRVFNMPLPVRRVVVLSRQIRAHRRADPLFDHVPRLVQTLHPPPRLKHCRNDERHFAQQPRTSIAARPRRSQGRQFVAGQEPLPTRRAREQFDRVGHRAQPITNDTAVLGWHHAMQVQDARLAVVRHPCMLDRIRERLPGRRRSRQERVHVTQPQWFRREQRRDDKFVAETMVPTVDRAPVRHRPTLLSPGCFQPIAPRRPLHRRKVIVKPRPHRSLSSVGNENHQYSLIRRT